MPSNATTNIDSYLRMLAERVPGLTVRACEVAGEGWDSVALLVNGELIVRIAKRADVALRLANEARLLPALAGMLHGTTLDVIPHFEYFCDDPASGGMRLVGYRKLMGVPLTHELLQRLPADAVELLSYDLANFLSLLHFYPVKDAASLIVPLGHARGDWREEYTAFYAEVREHILPLLHPAEQKRVAAFWEDYLSDDAHFRFEPCLIHRDLVPGDHILCDPATGRLAGIIDWGDASIGDPALDFTGLLCDLGRAFAERVAASYQGDIDATFWQRAEFYGRLPPFYEIRFGQHTGDSTHLQHGLDTLREAFAAE